MAAYDVVTFGETMIRLSTPVGLRLETATNVDLTIGGAESNVAVALARLGRDVAWASVLPQNALGERIGRELRWHGVDVSHVHWVPQGRVGVYFLDTGAPPRPTQVIYHRAGSAIARCAADDIDATIAARSRLLHVTGITPALSANCAEIVRRLVDTAHEAEVPIVFDVNYRSLLWSPAEAAEGLAPLCKQASVLICGRNDARVIWGLDGSDEAILQALADRFGAPITVLTLGEEGALARSTDGQLHHQPPLEAQVVDRVGAGDAFAAGFIHGYLDGDLSQALRYGVTLAALKMTIIGDLAILNGQEFAQWAEAGTRSIVR